MWPCQTNNTLYLYRSLNVFFEVYKIQQYLIVSVITVNKAEAYVTEITEAYRRLF